jgi:hypothetical protein
MIVWPLTMSLVADSVSTPCRPACVYRRVVAMLGSRWVTPTILATCALVLITLALVTAADAPPSAAATPPAPLPAPSTAAPTAAPVNSSNNTANSTAPAHGKAGDDTDGLWSSLRDLVRVRETIAAIGVSVMSILMSERNRRVVSRIESQQRDEKKREAVRDGMARYRAPLLKVAHDVQRRIFGMLSKRSLEKSAAMRWSAEELLHFVEFYVYQFGTNRARRVRTAAVPF